MKKWLTVMLVCGAAVFAPSASAADISFFSLTDTPDPQTAGSWVDYRAFVFCTTGGGTCTNVTVTFAIPLGGTFQSVTNLSGGCTPAPPQAGPTTVTCTLGTVNAGGSIGFNIWVSYATAGSHVLSGTAATDGDTNPLNNFTSEFTTITAASAVTLRSLVATRSASGVLVRWRTASELDSLGFHVYREVNGKRVRANTRMIAAKGRGSYSFLDRKAPKTKSVRYWVQEVAADGSRSWYGPARVTKRA